MRISTGIIKHLFAGRLGFICLGAAGYIRMRANYRPGMIRSGCVKTMFLASLLFPIFGRCGTASLDVIYPRREAATDDRSSYPEQILKLALDHSGVSYSLHASQTSMQQTRSLELLQEGKEIDVMWTATSASREQEATPIRIPIDRGLIGWRLLLIHQGDGPKFASISSKAQLAALSAVQGYDWPDLSVLRDNGLHVVAGASYESLFNMLEHRHIDYFPRSISEIQRELRAHPALQLEIEPHLVIHYPEALYFFVSPHNPELAKALTLGLHRAIADGSFMRCFDRSFSKTLRDLHINRRQIIELVNSELPTQTPPSNDSVWLNEAELP